MSENRRVFRFVLHGETEKYEAMGYRFASYIGGHHGQYSVIMEKVDDRGEDRKPAAYMRQWVRAC